MSASRPARALRTTRLRYLLTLLSVAGVAWIAPERPAAQAGGYTLVVLGGPGVADGGPAYDVNDNGVVVGYRLGGFTWTREGGVQLLGNDPSLTGTFPVVGSGPKWLALNDTGMVAGRGRQSSGSGILGAGLWTPETGYLFLGGGLDGGGTARAINSAGVVVGLYRANSGVPFIWDRETGIRILPGFSGERSGDANDINDTGTVVGRCSASASWCGTRDSAFTWSDEDGLQVLPSVHADGAHEAVAINNVGAVVGRFFANGAGTTPPGVFFWSPETGTVDLSAPAGLPRQLDINDRGDIVATITAPGGGFAPYLYRNGVWTNINDLRPAGSTLTLVEVMATNNSGWMVGTGSTCQTCGTNSGWVMIPPGTPVAQDGTIATDEDVPVAGQLVGSDPDGGSLTYSIQTNGTLGIATITNPTTGAFTYAPNHNASGTDTFTFKVTDGTSDSNVATITVEIQPINDAPVALNTTFPTLEDTPVNATLQATDADGNPMTFAIVTTGTKGTASLINPSTGAFSYSPSPNAVGTDVFTFKVSDGVLDSGTATFTIMIQPVNDAPVAANGSISVAAGASANGVLSAIDIDSPSLTYSIVASGTKGTVTITNTATGAFTYAANAGTSGTDTFTFTASDGALLSNVATVTVTIASGNQPPTATGSNFVTLEDRSISSTLIGSDPERSRLTFSVLSNGSKGTATITNTSTGRFNYVPNANATGADSFVFVVSDGTSSSTPAIVTVTITAVNDPPVAADLAVSTGRNTPITGQLPATDVEGDTLTFASGKGKMPKGALVISPAGSFSYTPPTNFIGSETFTFQVSDGPSATSGKVTVSVGP